ncbi:MAG: alpha-glucosidase (family GH31 glycosyl hydrolase) [Algoriphagus sp.]
MKTSFILLCLSLITCEKSEHRLWVQKAQDVWSLSIGDEPKINLLKAANAKPKLERLSVFESASLPFSLEAIKIRKDKDNVVIQIPLDSKEQIYGLGLQFKTVNRRSQILNLQVDHYGGRDDGRTHAPVPFYVSSKGYGLLINSASVITAYVGSSVRLDSKNKPPVKDRNLDESWDSQPPSDVIEMVIEAGNAEILLFSGNSTMEVVQKYNLYCGGGYLPPKWGLGFTYRTHTLHDAAEVEAEVTEFAKRDFPLDFIGLEPGWMNRSYPCSYEWDEIRFHEPEKMIKSLLDKGVRTNLWINPYIAPKAKLYDDLLPYAGSHLVWNGIVPDYSMPEARKVFSEFYTKNQLDIGVSGLKIDEVDGYDNWLWPKSATFPSGLSATEMRQTYGLQMQTMIADLYHAKNERTYGLVRASNAGSAHLPFVIYNDYYKHEDFITALINSGFSGLLWTPEVRQSDTAEEWLRRMQSVCFSPMAMINAWFSGTKPWSYPEVYNDVREVAKLRMALLPYIYSTFADYKFNGKPPIRPMQLLDGFIDDTSESLSNLDDTKNPYQLAIKKDIKDQYLFGESILVAPVFTGQTNRTVILPKGKWYDFYTGLYVGQNELIEIETPLSKIPLFVKDGGIIPMIEPRLHSPRPNEKLPLILKHYGTAANTFKLYDDDGVSFNFEKGDYSWTQLSISNTGTKEIKTSGRVFNYKDAVWQKVN